MSDKSSIERTIPASGLDGVRIGGLMRCCLQALDEHYPDGLAAKASEGEILPCRYCSSSMIFRDGFWKWNRAAEDGSE